MSSINKGKENIFNHESVRFRASDKDAIDYFKDVVLYDDKGNKILDAEFYNPQDKAYIVLNRVHYGEMYQDKEKEALEKLVAYFLYPDNLNYIASAIYMDIRGSNIEDDIADEVGFFQAKNCCWFMALLNWSFIEMLDDALISQDIKDDIIQDYLALKAKKLWHLETVRNQLNNAKAALSFFKMEDNYNELLVESKLREIEHYEAVLRAGDNSR